VRPVVAVVAVLAAGGPSLALANPPDTVDAARPGGVAAQQDSASQNALGNAASGERKSASCSSCHGPNGISPSHGMPRLAGQSAVYIAGQLTLFRSGLRNHPVMNPPAASLSDRDINDLAVYYEAQTSAAAKPAAGTSDDSAIEKQLRLQGYRQSMVRGQEMYCRRESPLGSRLESIMHCVTPAEAEVMAKEGKETTERIQRNQPGCLQPAQGGCGH